MKPNAAVGVVLTVCGLAALASQGIASTRRARVVVNVGSMYATVDRGNAMRAPVVGSAAVAGEPVVAAGGRPPRNARVIGF